MNAKRYWIARSVRGPVLMITVGTLFALHQSGVAPFERTWPLLIIVLGVMKLLERMAAPPVLPFPVNPAFGPNAPYSGAPYGTNPAFGQQPPYTQPGTYAQPPKGPAGPTL